MLTSIANAFLAARTRRGLHEYKEENERSHGDVTARKIHMEDTVAGSSTDEKRRRKMVPLADGSN